MLALGFIEEVLEREGCIMRAGLLDEAASDDSAPRDFTDERAFFWEPGAMGPLFAGMDAHAAKLRERAAQMVNTLFEAGGLHGLKHGPQGRAPAITWWCDGAVPMVKSRLDFDIFLLQHVL